MAVYLTDPPHKNECQCCRYWREKIERILVGLLDKKETTPDPKASEYHDVQADGFPNGADD